MLQEFSKSLIRISQKYLDISAHKFQIGQSININTATNALVQNYTIDLQKLQSILLTKFNKVVDRRCLNKLFFSQQQSLRPSKLYEYLETKPKSNTQCIMKIVGSQQFADLLGLEQEMVALFQNIKSCFERNSEKLFQSIDIKGIKTFDSFSIVNFIKSYAGCTISSKAASYIISIIKGRKGQSLHKEQWNRFFRKSNIGMIKNNRVKTLEKKISQYKSYQSCETLKPTLTSRHKDSPLAKSIRNPFNITSSFDRNYYYNKNILESTDFLVTNKLLSRKSRNWSRADDEEINFTKERSQLPTQLSINIPRFGAGTLSSIKRQNSKNSSKTSKVKIANKQKQPYQVYIDRKKQSQNKEELFSCLSQLNDLFGQREEYISRISSYQQFNPFNAFNILDSYDLGGINYGQFCRQLQNLEIHVTEQNKRNFWNQATNGNKYGLSYQNFVNLFKISSNSKYYESLATRQPILRRFQGIQSWKKELQYSFKQFLKEMINNIGKTRSTKFKIKSILFGDKSAFKLISNNQKLKLSQFNQMIGSDAKILYEQIANEGEQLTQLKFNNYFTH